MKYFTRFLNNLQKDLKAFIYWCLVFTLFRMAFIFIYSSQLNGIYNDVPMALLLGLRLSLKTAGMICVVGFVLATIPKIVLPSWPSKKTRLGWHTLALIFFAICFMARIPYYGIFNAAFNMMLINGMHDDIYAIIMTAIKEYQLLWRLPLAVVLGFLLALPLRYLLKNAVIDFGRLENKKAAVVSILIFLPILCVFVRYGGAFNYADSINWESAARLKSNLLNEAILDDGQALYRVRASKKMLDKVNNVQISKNELYNLVGLAGGNITANTIDTAFQHTVGNPKLTKQPSNVVLLVGESFGQWPFLPKFKDLGLVNSMLSLEASSQSVCIDTMLAHGSGTIHAINGLLTGLTDTGLYENYQPNSLKNVYASGIGYIMRQLGYKTVFWYGGFSGWQNLKNFVLAQSFDEFHCADEFDYAGGNAWGCPDELLLQKIAEYMKQEDKSQKVFHLILTTSNHPPYTLDVDKMGFPRDQIRSKLPTDIEKDDKILTELGHIWYADKTMGDFVQKTQKLHPDSLIVITGDHSERFSFVVEQDVRTLSSIPCIFYGQGVRSDWFGEQSIGCHIQLAGTLAEILAPRGFTYTALMPNMFENTRVVFNHRLYAKGDMIGIIDKNNNEMVKYINSLRSISAWRILKGNEIK